MHPTNRNVSKFMLFNVKVVGEFWFVHFTTPLSFFCGITHVPLPKAPSISILAIFLSLYTP